MNGLSLSGLQGQGETGAWTGPRGDCFHYLFILKKKQWHLPVRAGRVAMPGTPPLRSLPVILQRK